MGLQRFKVFTVLSASFTFSSLCPARPVEVGNGGDLVFCREDAAQEFNGTYALDFVATYQAQQGMAFFEPIAADPLQALADVIRAKSPALGQDFAQFLADYRAQVGSGLPNYLAKHVWIPAELGLVDIHDEYLFARLPSNCTDTSSNALNALQAVVREERPTATIYRYDRRQLDAVNTPERRLQLAFLMTHEWLWPFAPNASVLRDANRLIQSAQFRAMNGEQMITALENIGLVFDAVAPATDTLDVRGADFAALPTLHIAADRRFGSKIEIVNSGDILFEATQLIPLPPSGLVHRNSYMLGPQGSGENRRISMTFTYPGAIELQLYARELVDGYARYVEVGQSIRVVEVR